MQYSTPVIQFHLCVQPVDLMHMHNMKLVIAMHCDDTQHTCSSKMDEELQQFIQQKRAINTVKKTKCDMNAWNKWCRSNSEDRNMEDIPTRVRKMNGQEYKPDTFIR